ncbi:WD repeat-containing protein 27 [Quaeritorhiza haematococci]|nr:WD repeat-containing protein 27 [Quaeritorhiza haematococci]
MRNDRQLLITASSDALCLSKLRGQADPGPHVSSAAFLLEEDYVLLEKPPGKVSSLSFDAHEKRIAACIDEDVYVVSTLGADVGKVTRLEGHLSKVTAAEFCTHQGTHVIGDSRNWLISISEDRSFKGVVLFSSSCCETDLPDMAATFSNSYALIPIVWDVHEKACLYQSGIESPVPLTCVAVETQRLRMCIGSEDGRLRFYELTPTPTKARKGLPCEPRCLKIFESSPLFKLTLTKSNSQSSLVEVVSSIPSWRNPKSSKHPSQKDNEGGDIVDENHDVQPSNSVISLRYFEQQDPSVDFAGSGACLIVGLMHGIFVLDANVYMPIFHYDFRDTSIPLDVSCRQSLYEETEVETTTEMNDTLADGYAFAASHTGGSMTIMIGNTMSGCISLLNLYQSCIGSKSDFIGYDLDWDSFETLGEVVETIIQGHVQGPWLKNIYQDCMTKLASIGIMSLEMLLESDVDLPSNMPKYVVSALQRYKTNAVTNAATSALEMLSFSVPTEVQIYPDSPLQHAAKLRNSTNKEGTSSKSTAKSATKAKRDNLNKPVTFRTKVKSSGYIEGPKVTKLFTRSSSNTSTSSSTSRQTHRKISTSSVGYPMECSVISEHIKSNEPIVHSAPVTCVKFHPSGQYLATASVDKTARSYRFPVRSKSTSTKHFIGHNGMIHSAAWSHDRVVGQGPLLLTGAVDGTARLWTIEKSDPLLVFSNIHGSQCRKHSTNSINGSSGSSSASSSLFGSEIKQVAFYHRDQFIFIMNRNKLLLYSYNLEKPDPGSVKPQLNYNRYKLIRSFESETSHSVTSFASVNSFTSHLALCGTSDRALNCGYYGFD